MLNRGLVLSLVLIIAEVAAPSNSRKDVLFTRYFSATTPIFKSVIPVETCKALIAEADQINLRAAKERKAISNSHLQIGSENLRSCATNDSLSRQDRDLAVGLYAWISIEQNRREEFQK